MEQENTRCGSCYIPYQPGDAFCNGCGYPLLGTQQEKDFFISERNVKEIDLAELNQSVDRACKSLYWIAGLTVISTALGYAGVTSEEDKSGMLITGIVLFAAFIGLGFWSRSKPSAALISGLCLYVIVHLLSALVNPMTLISGIILKVIIIGYLVKGIKSVLEADKIKKELNIT